MAQQHYPFSLLVPPLPRPNRAPDGLVISDVWRLGFQPAGAGPARVELIIALQGGATPSAQAVANYAFPPALWGALASKAQQVSIHAYVPSVDFSLTLSYIECIL